MPRRKDLVATDLARKIWRSIGHCEFCNKTSTQVQLQGAHIFGTGAYPRLRDDLRNGLSLCASDHRRFTDNPLEFTDWIRTTKYGQYEQPLKEKNRTHVKRFWKERITELKDILKQIESEELTVDEARLYET